MVKITFVYDRKTDKNRTYIDSLDNKVN